MKQTLLRFCFLFAAAVTLASCGDGKATDTPASALTKVVILMDWYPQPEHGGFYQAQQKGYYQAVGLDVEVRSGGGIRDLRPLVALGQVDFAVGTSDTTLIGIDAGLPLIGLMPYFQHDPQCVMFHPELGVKTLKDLDGKVLMMQSSLSHATYMKEIMGLDLKFIPLDYSISRFATDKSFAQQCFLTAEPVHLAAKGIHPQVIPLSESGFDPYRHIYTSRKFLQDNPTLVKNFIQATQRGWQDFIANDPTPALEAIMVANPQQNMAMMNLAIAEMKKYSLVPGFTEQGDQPGKYQKARLLNQIQTLKDLKLIKPDIAFEDSFAIQQLPDQFN